MQVDYQASPSMFRNNPFLFLICILLIPAFGAGILMLLFWYVKSRSSTLTITPSMLIYEVGILSKAHTEMRLRDIRTVRINRSFSQRIFGTGDLEFFTTGDTPEVTTKGMPDPERVRALIAVGQQTAAPQTA